MRQHLEGVVRNVVVKFKFTDQTALNEALRSVVRAVYELPDDEGEKFIPLLCIIASPSQKTAWLSAPYRVHVAVLLRQQQHQQSLDVFRDAEIVLGSSHNLGIAVSCLRGELPVADVARAVAESMQRAHDEQGPRWSTLVQNEKTPLFPVDEL